MSFLFDGSPFARGKLDSMPLATIRLPVLLVLALAIIVIVLVFLAKEPTALPEPESRSASLAEIVCLRPLVKDQLAVDVATGRRSLIDVATLFDALDRRPPVPEEVLPPPSTGTTHAEVLCRQVISCVERLFIADPDRRAIVSARLRAELQRALDQAEVLRLSDLESLESLDSLLARARGRMPATFKTFAPKEIPAAPRKP
jgi:hypothetical protein